MTSSASPRFASQLRGLETLQLAFVMTLVVSILSGLWHAYTVQQIYSDSRSLHTLSFLPQLLSTGFQVVSIGAQVLLLIGLLSLLRTPPSEQVGQLIRGAQLATLLLLIPQVGQLLLPLYRRGMSDALFFGQLMMYVGFIRLLLSLAARGLIIEAVLRLRALAAPQDRVVTEQESALRAGLWGSMVASAALGVGIYPLMEMLGLNSLRSPWLMFVIQEPLVLLFLGLLLWLLKATMAALTTAQETDGQPAPAQSDTAAADSDAAYKHILFGTLWLVIGIGVTAYTYSSVSPLGGRYVIAYGAIITGVLQLGAGLVKLLRR
ncbi:MAG: hypothetical protein JNM83_27685 [Myxococcales bacterium]|nr:hypothetical protein [Myxococcales bacterium]